MINLITGLFNKLTKGPKEQKVIIEAPKAKSDDEIKNYLQKNVQDFTIEKHTVDYSNIDSKYYNQLFDAIDRSKSVQELILPTVDVRKEDWQVITNRIINNNNISKITLFIKFSAELDFEVTNLLAKSESINTLSLIFPRNDNDETDNYRHQLEAVSKGISENTNIQSIQIADLKEHIQPDAIQPLFEAIRKNQIQSLHIFDCGSHTATIASQLHQSSITSLSVNERSTLDIGSVVQLAEFIAKNRNITKLHLTCPGVNDRTIGPLVDAIKNSKNLTKLVLCNMDMEPFIADIVAHNTSITSLSWYNYEETDLEYLSEKLKKNSTLTILDLQCNYITAQGYIHLGEAMNINSSIKKLLISIRSDRRNIELNPLFEGLKFNTGLNELYLFGRYLSLWYPIEEFLKTNRALIEIKKGSEDDQPHPQLLLNKRNQDEVVLGGKSLVRAIYWHTNSFLALLPLELWYMILSHARHPGVAINFERALKELFRRNNKLQ